MVGIVTRRNHFRKFFRECRRRGAEGGDNSTFRMWQDCHRFCSGIFAGTDSADVVCLRALERHALVGVRSTPIVRSWGGACPGTAGEWTVGSTVDPISYPRQNLEPAGNGRWAPAYRRREPRRDIAA